jgi:hypothetical protein
MGRMVVALVVATAILGGRADALVLCTKAKSGAVKEGAPIKLRTACTAKEVQVDPDATGLRGPQGPAGQNGSNGTNGLNGVSGVEVVTANGGTVISGLNASLAIALCPEGKKAIGGGVSTVLIAGSWTTRGVTASRPDTSMGEGWYGEVVGQASDDWYAVVHAVCANVVP